jgi:hypothetical protein
MGPDHFTRPRTTGWVAAARNYPRAQAMFGRAVAEWARAPQPDALPDHSNYALHHGFRRGRVCISAIADREHTQPALPGVNSADGLAGAMPRKEN